MATKYWVGGTGTWNGTSATNWSLTSGTMTATTAPGSTDDVIFDSGSNATSYVVTTTSAAVCRSFTVSGPASGTVTFAGTGAPRVYGSILFSTPGSMVWSNTGTIILSDGSANSTITTNNLAMTCALSCQRVTYTTTLGSAFTTSDTLTLLSGTLDLSSYTLTCFNVVNNSGSTRRIAFGTGKIVVTGNGTTVYSQSVVTGLTYTGTPLVELSYSGGGTVTVNTSTSASAALAISLKLTGAGTYTLAQGAAGNFFMDLDFSGHQGPTPSGAYTVYGNYTLSSAAGFSVPSSASAITFAATSSKTITTNGYTVDRPITFNGAGGTWVLQDAFSIGPTATRVVTHNAGTLDLNGNTLTAPLYATGAGTKNLTFNSGSLVVTASGTTAFNNAAPTNYTTTAGTGAGTISMTSASAKTFVGGGSTFNATLNQGGAGTLTITGANKFEDISNTVQPATVLFTAGTTTTFLNGFSLRGTAGNLITIGSVTAANHTLSKASGTISTDYLSISRSVATGGAEWYAGLNSTDGGNNTGWFFSEPITAVNVTGVNAASAVGSASVNISVNALVTGTSAATSTGSATVTGPPTVVALGGWDRSIGWGLGPFGTGSISAEAATAVGSPTISVSSSVSVTGVFASGQVGEVTLAISSFVNATGSSATGQVGGVQATIGIDANVTGIAATGQVGTNRVDIDYFVFPTGVSAAVQTNSVFAGVVIDCDVYVAGLQVIGYVGQVLVWGQIVPSQTPDWTEIVPVDSPGWVEIAPSQSPNWTQIAA